VGLRRALPQPLADEAEEEDRKGGPQGPPFLVCKQGGCCHVGIHSSMRTTLSLVFFVAGCGLLAASALASAQQGGPDQALRVSWAIDIDYVDPALAYYVPSWSLEYATGVMLLSYPDAPAPRGSRLIPEVATGFPTISRDGRSYTFRLKRTYRFNTGRRVTAHSFARALHRALNRKMAAPAQAFVDDIVGARQMIEHGAQRASGVRVLDPYTLRIRLTRPAPDLLARLAMPFFMAVPRTLEIDPEGIDAPVVSAGPYFIREWTRSRRIVLERNRFYRGPRPHRVHRILVDVGLPPSTIKLNIDNGATDLGDLPPTAHAEVGRRYGVRRRSPGRYFANPAATVLFFVMNHDRRLFGGPTPLGNIRLKRAVNFAIDRRTMMRQYGAYAGSVHDQLLPPTMRGFRNAAIYPRRPNLGAARALARGALRQARGTMYCRYRSPAPEICQVVQSNLREIGLDMDVRLDSRVGLPIRRVRGEPFDMDIDSWHMDYFDPYNFLFLVDGTTIRPAGNTNLSYFNHPGYNRKLAAAQALVGPHRYPAFAALDEDLMRNAAPVAVYGTANERHYVSARTGCYHHHPVYGLDFPTLCVR
jgi:ABC-type oligopeptide transport system substrate-binding subunit